MTESIIHKVEITGFSFAPEVLTISVGDCIIWVNRDDAVHTATRTDEPPFDTGDLEKDQESDAITFEVATEDDGIEYICSPHPFMTGRIVVI